MNRRQTFSIITASIATFFGRDAVQAMDEIRDPANPYGAAKDGDTITCDGRKQIATNCVHGMIRFHAIDGGNPSGFEIMSIDCCWHPFDFCSHLHCRESA